MKKVVIIFGGVSAEHEVSVITGLQVVEKIDKTKYEIYPIKLGQDGLFYYYSGLKGKKSYKNTKPSIVSFGKDSLGPYFQTTSLLRKKVYPQAAYLACHGGNGESGQLQGFMEILNIPYTSSSVESSSISMNKALTKEVLESQGIATVSWLRFFSFEIRHNLKKVTSETLKYLKLPIIVKPAHLGSSIGISIAKTEIELKKALLEASFTDSEIIIEKFLTKFDEYNISINKFGNEIHLSEIEQPISKDEILSFADKYLRGGKKSGGMASLPRKLPAKITSTLRKKIQNQAKKAYIAIRARGRIRIDFAWTGKSLFVLEVNPIPGSMGYYLWEVEGISFKDQISQDIEECIQCNKESNSYVLKYETDILERFVNQKSD